MSSTSPDTLSEFLRHTDPVGNPLSEMLHRRFFDVPASSGMCVGFPPYVISRVENLAYQTTFDAKSGDGDVVLNLSVVPEAQFEAAMTIIQSVIGAGVGMGRFIRVERESGEARRIILGTLSSITFDGILRARGIPIVARFGGLLELKKRIPVRFTQIIHYDSTTIDPMVIFIKGGMTRVHSAAESGTGIIGAGFREIPASSLTVVRALAQTLAQKGIGGMLHIGEPGRPLLGIPVSASRVGLLITAGLNPVAAVEECGIPTRSVAMSFPFEFRKLTPAV